LKGFPVPATSAGGEDGRKRFSGFSASMNSTRLFTPSFPLLLFAGSLTLGDAVSAVPHEVTPSRIEVFTASDRLIQPSA
jgi:hypothetical protein